MSDEKRCKETVYIPGGPFRGNQCANRATVGDYCKIHDPERVAARRAARVAKWNAEWKARQEAETARLAAIKAKADLERRTVALLSDLAGEAQSLGAHNLAERCRALLAEWKDGKA